MRAAEAEFDRTCLRATDREGEAAVEEETFDLLRFALPHRYIY